MKTYVSLGIGDAVCIDSLLTQEERNNITEMYWACRFGKIASELFNNRFYPNLTKHHFISDEAGMNEMMNVDRNAANFWHFRPDFPASRRAGLRLFNLNEGDVSYIDACALLSSKRAFTNSSFIDSADKDNLDWSKISSEPYKYILFHYPTSTRPRSDIASIDSDDWAFIERVSEETGRKVVVITDCDINPPLSNFSIFKDLTILEIMVLCKYAYFYCGCDSFISIACCKSLPKERISIKSHNRNIQEDIQRNSYQQKYFLPFNGQEVSQFYKSYLG